MSTVTFFDNLIGRSDSLRPVVQAIAIRRQGNGNLAVSLFSKWSTGREGHSDIGLNFKALSEAQAYAESEAAQRGLGRPVVLTCALA